MQHFFYYKTSKIFYTDIGIGSCVVMLHGFGEDASIWNKQKEFLQNNYRIIIPSLPGTGNSELLKSDESSINDFALCIYELVNSITSLQNSKIVLLGHSMGGYITLAFAKFFPVKLSALGLIHSTAFADNDDKIESRKRGIEMIKEYGSHSFLKNTIPNLFANNFKKENNKIVDALIEDGKNFSVESLCQYYNAMMNRKSTVDVLQNSKIPVLFIMGTEDVAAPLKDVLQQCHLPNQSHICILKNVGHMGMLEATEEFNNCINNFLREIN